MDRGRRNRNRTFSLGRSAFNNCIPCRITFPDYPDAAITKKAIVLDYFTHWADDLAEMGGRPLPRNIFEKIDRGTSGSCRVFQYQYGIYPTKLTD